MISKWFGDIGFGETVDKGDGIYEEEIEERNYFGKIINSRRRYQAPGKVNDDITMSVKISILSDHFINQHLDNIKYVTYMGTKWHVTEIVPMYPRLELTLGGVYNG